MPTMRDMTYLILSERFVEIVDHRPEVGAGSKGLLEPQEDGLRIDPGVHRTIPLGKTTEDGRLADRLPFDQPLPLPCQSLPGLGVEAGGLCLLQRLLDFQHFLEK